MMTPWIVMTGIGLVLQIGSILMAVTSLAFGSAISDIFAWVLGAYFFLVVWSYKAEVEEGKTVGDLNYKGKVHYQKEYKELQKA